MPERTPKSAFLQNPLREDWEKIVATKAAETARDAALLQFVLELPAAIDPSKGWDQASQLTGAKRVLDILFNLPFREETRPAMKLTQIPIPK